MQMISRTIELERVNNELKAENESLKTENSHLSRVNAENAQLQLEIQHLKVSCYILFTFGIVVEFILHFVVSFCVVCSRVAYPASCCIVLC